MSNGVIDLKGITDDWHPVRSIGRAEPPALAPRVEPKRLASVTLPVTTNDGQSTIDAHSWATRQLLTTFGGYSSVAVSGAWLDDTTGVIYRDASVRYEVAMENHGFNVERMHQIAVEAGKLAKQLAVAVVNPDGTFVILPIEG